MKMLLVQSMLLLVAPVWTIYNPSMEKRLESDILLKHGYTQFSGWSIWNSWGPCTRSCDGGVSIHSRKCLHKTGCIGAKKQYKICNMQPCFEQVDFRNLQCSLHNNEPHLGELHDWHSVNDPEQPCTLSCKSNKTGDVVIFSYVEDGTRCRKGSLDMCVSGRCLTIGCDLKLDSKKIIDACGICGGDGTSCQFSSYYWSKTIMSTCSVTCGGGFKMSKPTCKNRASGEDVEEWFCDATVRPRQFIQECNVIPCPSEWQTENWSECSAACGGGTQWRAVYCVEGRGNSSQVRVDDKRCPLDRPQAERICNDFKCPEWVEGSWSDCSTSCGHGYRTRPVICTDFSGKPNQSCDPQQKPSNREKCESLAGCIGVKTDSELPKPMHQNSASLKPRFVALEWGPCSATCGWGMRQREINCKGFVEYSGEVNRLSEEDCEGEIKPDHNEKCFLRACDYESTDIDDADGIAEIGSNSIEYDTIDEEYKWRTSGFTECSASCLGGVRESIIECVRMRDDSIASPSLCDLSSKPDQLIQTCNNRPCPPRWNISDFSPCTKKCGGGTQQRTIHCIHEITRGNTLSVADKLCPQPQPRKERLCGAISCPIRWKAEPWSQCSKSCGGGVKTRTVKCQRILAYGQIVDQPLAKCKRRKPRTVKSCKSKSCPKRPNRKIPKIISDVKQAFVQTRMKKKVSLKVGGKATVFKGVNLKLKCRVKGNFDRSKLIWIKNRNFIKSTNKRYSVSKNGALRIKAISYDDSGFYICKANKAQANITVIVKPRTADIETFSNSIDNDEKVRTKPSIKRRRKKGGKKRRRKKKQKTDKVDNLNYSHEDVDRKKPRNGKRHRGKSTQISSSLDILKKIRGSKHPNHNSRRQDPNGGYVTYNAHNERGRKVERKFSVESQELRGTRVNEQDKKGIEGIRQLYGKMKSSSKNGKTLGMRELFNELYTSPPLADRHTSNQDHSHEELISNDENPEKERLTPANYQWTIGHWSKCSVKCGELGFEVRTARCFAKFGSKTKPVEKSQCIAVGLAAPITVKQCGSTECPEWSTSEWSKCNRARCVGENKSIVRRKVFCKLINGTKVENSKCPKKTKPRQRRECFNNNCKGTWKVGTWSQVRRSSRKNSAQQHARKEDNTEGDFSNASGVTLTHQQVKPAKD